NEARFIGMTIESVLTQTVKPLKWVIVDDGSTDETPSIIQQYVARCPWIHYVRREKVAGQHYFASNVFGIQEGYRGLGNLPYDFLAILDADISLPPNYYKQILSRLCADEKLGVASGVYVDRLPDGNLRKVLNDRRSTPKSITVFRRSCYEDIGGFVPMKYGGEDTVACFIARMKGWKTWSYPDVEVIHNKPIGTGHASNLLKIRYRQGRGEWFLGTHPAFFLLKSLRRCVKEPPFLFGGMARMMGYFFGILSREPRQISEDLVRFIRREQCHRILGFNSIPKEIAVKADHSHSLLPSQEGQLHSKIQ
ncbi:MAG: glycosyltransferase family 2 protein, partial [Phycisphaerae bacterium]|nr:glycosyltransferase family 2 protein [Phycisphaerae bacterium]